LTDFSLAKSRLGQSKATYDMELQTQLETSNTGGHLSE